MPVKIIRKAPQAAAPAPEPAQAPAEAVEAPAAPAKLIAPAPASDRPKLTKITKIGDSLVLPTVDLHTEQGKEKFMVNYKKQDIWYHVLATSEDGDQLRLRTPTGNTFDSRRYANVIDRYFVVVEPAGAKHPSKAALEFIQKLAHREPDSVQLDETIAAAEQAPAVTVKTGAGKPPPAPAKKGGISIKRKAKK